MKTTTNRIGHPPSRDTPVVSVSKPKPKAKITTAPVPHRACVKPHPAEQAGMAVHQAVENGVATVADGLATAGGYVFGFVKGLIKGH